MEYIVQKLKTRSIGTPEQIDQAARIVTTKIVDPRSIRGSGGEGFTSSFFDSNEYIVNTVEYYTRDRRSDRKILQQDVDLLDILHVPDLENSINEGKRNREKISDEELDGMVVQAKKYYREKLEKYRRLPPTQRKKIVEDILEIASTHFPFNDYSADAFIAYFKYPQLDSYYRIVEFVPQRAIPEVWNSSPDVRRCIAVILDILNPSYIGASLTSQSQKSFIGKIAMVKGYYFSSTLIATIENLGFTKLFTKINLKRSKHRLPPPTYEETTQSGGQETTQPVLFTQNEDIFSESYSPSYHHFQYEESIPFSHQYEMVRNQLGLASPVLEEEDQAGPSVQNYQNLASSMIERYHHNEEAGPSQQQISTSRTNFYIINNGKVQVEYHVIGTKREIYMVCKQLDTHQMFQTLNIEDALFPVMLLEDKKLLAFNIEGSAYVLTEHTYEYVGGYKRGTDISEENNSNFDIGFCSNYIYVFLQQRGQEKCAYILPTEGNNSLPEKIQKPTLEQELQIQECEYSRTKRRKYMEDFDRKHLA